MPNHFILFLNAHCICSVLNKRPDHLQTRQSSVAVPTAFCCKPLHMRKGKDVLKFNQIWQDDISMKISSNVLNMWWFQKILPEKHLEPKNWVPKNGCRSFGNLREWHHGCNDGGGTPIFFDDGKGGGVCGPSSGGRQKTWKPWKCGKKTYGRYWEFCEDVLDFTLHLKAVFKMIRCNKSFPVSFVAAF